MNKYTCILPYSYSVHRTMKGLKLAARDAMKSGLKPEIYKRIKLKKKK